MKCVQDLIKADDENILINQLFFDACTGQDLEILRFMLDFDFDLFLGDGIAIKIAVHFKTFLVLDILLEKARRSDQQDKLQQLIRDSSPDKQQ